MISDAGVFNTFTELLPEHAPHHDHYRERLGRVNRSMASACLYIGLNDTAENLGLPKTNYWIYPDNDYEGQLDRALADPDHHDIPLTYISFPSAKDPDFTRRYPGRATVEIVAAAPYQWYQRWDGTTWGQRGEDYEADKEAFAQRLLEKLFEKHPNLRAHLDYYELSTPLSTAWFCRYPTGEIYGLDHDPNRFQQDWLRPKTRIPGLYLTGQDVLTCGVVGALVAGLATTLAVTGRRACRWRGACSWADPMEGVRFWLALIALAPLLMAQARRAAATPRAFRKPAARTTARPARDRWPPACWWWANPPPPASAWPNTTRGWVVSWHGRCTPARQERWAGG